jgi:TonB family protein
MARTGHSYGTVFLGLWPAFVAYYAQTFSQGAVSLNVFHNPLSRADHDFLPSPKQPALHEPKQRRMMAVALALLVIALAVVLYQDRDFWFPDTQADDQLEPAPTSATPHLDIKAAAQPAGAPLAKNEKSATADKKNHSAKSTSRDLVPAAAAAASTDADVNAPPMTATTTRTVLPPLEVEVIAGDNHRKLRPGSNGVHVDLQSSARMQPPSDALIINGVPFKSPPVDNTPVAAEVTTNAAEHVQMSADTSEAVSKSVQPAYPMLARQMKVQGSVVLQALIGRDGSIQSLKVLSGPAILASAAEEAVRQWRFKPHMVNSEAVETQAKITVNFTISTS